MSYIDNLKAIIAANVYTNGNNEVTAAMVKAALDSVVDMLFPQVSEDGWFLVDELLNIAMKYDADGLDVAKASDHFVELLKQSGIAGDSPALSCFAFTNEPGFAIVDPLLNIGVKVDQLGIHSQSILEFEIVNS